jgi:hypothetical protein
MKHFFILLAIMISSQMNAQIFLKGKTVTNQNVPLPFCTIRILSVKDSSLLQVLSSDSAGVFSIQLNNIDSALISASFIGFKQTISFVAIDKLDSPIKTVYKVLTLESDEKGLKEVEITAKKTVFEKKIDRFVFNVENSLITSGNTVYDVLGKTPMVQVVGNGISVIGKGSAGILLNDKYLYLSGDDLTNFLKSIPSDNIIKIEIITNPPAKYEASGGSLINIVTKKSILPGTNGTAYTTYTQAFYPTGQIGLILNNRKKKINTYGNLSYTKGSTHPVEKTDILYETKKFNQIENSKLNASNLYARIGIDYDINKKNSLSILYSSSTNSSNAKNSSIADFKKLSDVIDSTMLIDLNSKLFASTNTLNLNYTSNIDSIGKKISIDVDLLQFYNSRNRNLNSVTYLQPSFVNSSGNNNVAISSQLINIGTFKMDAEWPTKIVRLDYGAKVNWISNRSNNSVFNNLKSNQILDTLQSNNFIYQESTQALYLTVSKQIKKIEIQAGLRFENTLLNGYTPIFNDKINKVNRKYPNLFPSAYFLYNINESNSLSFSYDRRIDRPAYSALNPFKYYFTPYMYTQGNPLLLPSFFNTLTCTYTLKQKYTVAVMYSDMVNCYSQVPIQTDPNTLVYFQNNVGNVYQYTAYGVVPLSFGKHVEGSMVLCYVKSFYKTTVQNFYGYQRDIYLADINGQFYWGKNNRFSASLSAHLKPFGSNFAMTHNYHQNIVDAGIKLALRNRTLIFFIGVNDIFNESTPSGETKAETFDIKFINRYDTRNFKISFSYKFGYKGVKGSRQRNTGNDDEKNRIKTM